MGDISGIEVSDVLGLSDPITKLIETVSAGVGKLYEPTHVRRMAKAKAEEIKLLGTTVYDNSKLPIKYEDGSVLIDGTDFTELANRTGKRLVYQEMRKQQNIDAVVSQAANVLEETPSVSDTPVDEDWTMRFFDSVANVSSDEMQILWGKILAGEISQPGTFSLRTLDAVKNLSKDDAQVFQKLAPHIFRGGNNYFISSDEKMLSQWQIGLVHILKMEECGLMNSNSLTYSSEISPHLKDRYIENSKKIAFVENVSDTKQKISMGVYTLTSIGSQIFEVINIESDEKMMLDMLEKVSKQNKGKIQISVHTIVEKGDNRQVRYVVSPDETFE